MRRGEIWTSAGGAPYASKPRPALILQDEVYHETSSIVVCPLTSEQITTPFFRPTLQPNPINGLMMPSRVMIDKIAAVPRTNLGHMVGRIAADDMGAVELALLTFLGVAR